MAGAGMATQDEQDPITGLLSALFGGFDNAQDEPAKARAKQDAPITARLNSDPSSMRDYPDIFSIFGQQQPQNEVGPAPTPRPLPDPSAGQRNMAAPITAPGGPIFDNRPPGTAPQAQPIPNAPMPPPQAQPLPNAPMPPPQAQPIPNAQPAGGAPDDGMRGFLNAAIPDPTFLQRLSAGAAATQGSSGIIPGLGRFFGTMDAVGASAPLQRAKLGATMEALVKAGATPKEAMAMAMDPKAMEKILPELMPYAAQQRHAELMKTQAETTKTQRESAKPFAIGTDQLTGETTYGVFDPKTGHPVPLSSVMNGSAGSGPTVDGGDSSSGGGLGNLIAGPGETQLQGPEFLDRLKQQAPAFGLKIERIGKGLDPYPAPMRNGKPNRLAVAAGLAYPEENFAIDPNARIKAYQSFVLNQNSVAGNIKAIAQMDDHVGKFIPLIEKLDNVDFAPANAVRNKYADVMGGERKAIVRSFNTLKAGIVDEFGRVFKGGQPTNFNIKQWEENFRSDDDTATLKAAVKEGLSMTRGRLDAIKSEWDTVYKGREPYPKNLVDAEEKLNKAEIRLNGAGATEKGPAGPAILGGQASEPAGQAAPTIAAPPASARMNSPSQALYAPSVPAPSADSVQNPFASGAGTPPVSKMIMPGNTPESGNAPGASALGGGGGPASSPAPSAPPSIPGPQIAPPAQAAPPPGDGPAIMNPAAPPAQAAHSPKGGLESLPLVGSVMQIDPIPVGSYFRTPTGDVFERIQPYPGFRKVMGGVGTPELPGGEGASSPTGGAPQSAAPGKQAMLPGGVPSPAIGRIEFAQGPNGVPIPHRFTGGDESDPANWARINPEQRATA
jgi:hypothetical protein